MTQTSQIRSISDLHASARGHLEGNYKKSAGILLSYILFCGFISLVSPGNAYTKSLTANIIALILAVLLETIPFLLKAGLYNFYIKLCCNVENKTQDLFCGFTINGVRNWIYSAIILVIQSLIYLPATLYLTGLITNGVSDLKTGLILLFAGALVNFVISIFISQVFFLMFDFPDKTYLELIQLSIYLIKGHEIKYILIILSFLPLEIFGYLSLGIGLIWVIPYKISTLACFYLDLTKSNTGN